MQKIKLLALDIDGTLIADQGAPIAPRDKEAIKRAQEAGVYVTIATGRIYGTARHWIHLLDIDGPVILCNGADIRDGGKTWFRDSLPKERAKEIMDAYRETGQKRYLFSDNKIYCTKDDYYKILFEKWEQGEEGHFPVEIYDTEGEMYDAMPEYAEKVLIWAPCDELTSQLNSIAQTFFGRYNVVRGEARNVEFNKLGVSKGSGLVRLAELLKIPIEQVMAIGDSGNDVEMLKSAGLGVAMGNAMEEAKSAADYITGDVIDCGVAQAIEKFILI